MTMRTLVVLTGMIFGTVAHADGALKEFIGRGYVQVTYSLDGAQISQPGSYASIGDVSFEVNGAETVFDFCTYVTKKPGDFSYICADTSGVYEADYYKARKTFRITRNEISAVTNGWMLATTATFTVPATKKACVVLRETTFAKQNAHVVITQKATLCSGSILKREVTLTK